MYNYLQAKSTENGRKMRKNAHKFALLRKKKSLFLYFQSTKLKYNFIYFLVASKHKNEKKLKAIKLTVEDILKSIKKYKCSACKADHVQFNMKLVSTTSLG